MTDDVLALIPARGGSKGIPRKNLLEVGGRPLIAWSVLHALEAQRITRVVVSTDDPEIADAARDAGAEVPFLRPAVFAQDASPDIDVFRHTLSWLAEHHSYRPAMVVHLRPTGPVRRVSDIDLAIDLLASRPEADAVRSVSMVHQTPYKMWALTDDGLMEPLLRLPGVADAQSQARQTLPLVYHQNGYVDVIRPRAIFEHNSMWGERVIPFIVETTVLDLDYPEDIAPIELALGGSDKPRPYEAGRVTSVRYPV